MAVTTVTNPLGTAAQAFSPSTVGQVTGQEQTLASWAAPYVTNMLGQAQALGNLPYQTYQGPLTAGAAPLQQQAFTQAGTLGMPSDVTGAAQSAADVGTAAGKLSYTPIGGSFTDTGIAAQYMNPYMQQVLAPQLQQMQRQADIQKNVLGAQAARSGAFGGARAGLMGSQLGAELMRQQQQATGQAYGQAYTQGLGQYNVEQARKAQEAQFGAQYGLQGLAQQLAAAQARGAMGATQADIARQNLAAQLAAGAQQRDITQQGVAADVAEFEKQRMYPYQQLQFQQAMMQGLPISAVNYAYQQPSYFSNLMTGTGGLMDLYNAIFNPKPTK